VPDLRPRPIRTSRQRGRELLPRRVEQQLAGVREPTADDEAAGVQQGSEARQAVSQPPSDDGEALQGSRVPLRRGLRHLTRLDALRRSVAELEQSPAVLRLHVGDLTGLVQQRPAGAVLLPAARLPAPAPAAVQHDLQVAELAPDPERAAKQRATENDAAADPRADRDADQGGLPAAGTEAVLAPGRRVGVVLDHDRQADELRHLVAERLVTPGEVGREEHRRAVGVDEARGADADGDDVVRAPQLVHQIRDRLLDGPRVRGRGGSTQVRDHPPVLVDDTRSDLRAADVDPDRQRHLSPP
jgi:hypothetical protein